MRNKGQFVTMKHLLVEGDYTRDENIGGGYNGSSSRVRGDKGEQVFRCGKLRNNLYIEKSDLTKEDKNKWDIWIANGSIVPFIPESKTGQIIPEISLSFLGLTKTMIEKLGEEGIENLRGLALRADDKAIQSILGDKLDPIRSEFKF